MAQLRRRFSRSASSSATGPCSISQDANTMSAVWVLLNPMHGRTSSGARPRPCCAFMAVMVWRFSMSYPIGMRTIRSSMPRTRPWEPSASCMSSSEEADWALSSGAVKRSVLEHQPSKLVVAGSIPAGRAKKQERSCYYGAKYGKFLGLTYEDLSRQSEGFLRWRGPRHRHRGAVAQGLWCADLRPARDRPQPPCCELAQIKGSGVRRGAERSSGRPDRDLQRAWRRQVRLGRGQAAGLEDHRCDVSTRHQGP